MKTPPLSNNGSANQPKRIPAAPTVTGQCAQVLNLIRQHQPILSFTLTADYAIPEAAARVHDLRAIGFNIRTTILPEVEFRGRIRRNAAQYYMGSPEWPAPGFLPSPDLGGDVAQNDGSPPRPDGKVA